jgi:hypothetical protein
METHLYTDSEDNNTATRDHIAHALVAWENDHSRRTTRPDNHDPYALTDASFLVQKTRGRLQKRSAQWMQA